jgi:hypothetical protein
MVLAKPIGTDQGLKTFEYTRPGRKTITSRCGHSSFKNYSASNFMSEYFCKLGMGKIDASAERKINRPLVPYF